MSLNSSFICSPFVDHWDKWMITSTFSSLPSITSPLTSPLALDHDSVSSRLLEYLILVNAVLIPFPLSTFFSSFSSGCLYWSEIR